MAADESSKVPLYCDMVCGGKRLMSHTQHFQLNLNCIQNAQICLSESMMGAAGVEGMDSEVGGEEDCMAPQAETPAHHSHLVPLCPSTD